MCVADFRFFFFRLYRTRPAEKRGFVGMWDSESSRRDSIFTGLLHRTGLERRSVHAKAAPFVFPFHEDSALLHVIGRTYFKRGDAIGYLAANDRTRISTKFTFNPSNSILMSSHSQDTKWRTLTEIHSVQSNYVSNRRFFNSKWRKWRSYMLTLLSDRFFFFFFLNQINSTFLS